MELQRLNQRQFAKFRDLIYDMCGISMDSRKLLLLSNRLRKRLKACSLDSFDDYYRFLKSPDGADEIECFLDVLTTNETFFFRTEKHFDWLMTDFLSDLIRKNREGARAPSLKIWSAGCSTGAEPYSIAMCLADNRYRLKDWTLEIIGTDLSEEVLRTAREGVFKDRIIEMVSEKRRKRYFRQQADSGLWQLRSEIRKMVKFQQQNLIEATPGKNFDCIFIRNVLIYFDRKSKQIVIDKLIDALAKGGYLVVGPSEGITDMLSPLQKISPLLYQKPAGNISVKRTANGKGL